jgi:hypothetical protein
LEVKVTAPLVAATASPQTTLAATCVTGPAVFPALGSTNPRTSILKRPSSVSTATPCLTTQGAPPLATPAIVTPGFDPITGAKNENSSANVLTANIPAKTQAITTVESVFIFDHSSFLKNRARSTWTSSPPAKPVDESPPETPSWLFV